MNTNFNKLTEDEQIAQMRNFLNKNYKVSDERADSKITHNFTIIYERRHIEIILQFVNTYIQLNYDVTVLQHEYLHATIKSLKKINYLKTKIEEFLNKIKELEEEFFENSQKC